MICKDCMYYDSSTPTPFPGGRCYGYFGKGKILVKATDYCSRGKRGTFEEYKLMKKKTWEHIIGEMMERWKNETCK